MAGIDLTAVMEGLATATQTVLATGKVAYAFPVEGVTPGDAVVGYPGDITIAMTFRRGADRATFPLYLIAGLPQDEATRDAIAVAITGSGSIVTAIESYSTTAWGTVSVLTASVEPYEPYGMPPQLAVRYDIDVISR